MPSIAFEDRAVAFVDVLGFKALVNNAVEEAAGLDRLRDLVDLLETAVPTLDAGVSASVARHLIPRHLYISDSIILSAPMVDKERADYCGLSIIVMRVIQLSHFFLRAGFLLRGGISVGKAWHAEGNIVGPAYQAAYAAEALAKDPIVVLTDDAKRRWKGGSRMCLEATGRVFVNSLFDFYIPNSTEHGAIEAAYGKYEQFADEALGSPDLSESAKDKWRWFKSFLATEKPEGMKWAQA